MKKMILLSLCLTSNVFANIVTYKEVWNRPNWNEDAKIETDNRSNIFQLNQENLNYYNRAGRLHALNYPVGPTGLLAPIRPMEELSDSNDNIIVSAIKAVFKVTKNIGGIQDFFQWMGMKKYPESEGVGTYYVPFKNEEVKKYPMGITVYEKNKVKVATASCTACHAENLFGKTIIGMPNKTPRANNVFQAGKSYLPWMIPEALQLVTSATKEEVAYMSDLKNKFRHIGTKTPSVLGLDTSLATVALSFALREDDSYATITEHAIRNPRHNQLSTMITDSKPMPWWNTKYKNRWLSDGSVVSGNPIYTNFLWNEIGRGADLYKLETWLESDEGKQAVTELTAAVFASTAPKYTDFFNASTIDIEQAKNGEKIFLETCAKCHGTYEKAWNIKTAYQLSDSELLDTVKVNYPKQTKVKDVGTDPNRYKGMEYFYKDLNKLTISQKMGVVVKPQVGYVPPPLVGIWARWPYFHNNSAPTLCDVLTKPEERTKIFYVGPAQNSKTDFDQKCNGYPVAQAVPQSWRKADRRFDTRKAGLRNTGHFFREFTQNEKEDLIMFLKTL